MKSQHLRMHRTEVTGQQSSAPRARRVKHARAVRQRVERTEGTSTIQARAGRVGTRVALGISKTRHCATGICPRGSCRDTCAHFVLPRLGLGTGLLFIFRCRHLVVGCRVRRPPQNTFLLALSTPGHGCRVEGVGCRVEGAGCRVEGVACRVKVAPAVRKLLATADAFRVQGFGFGV